MCLPRLPVLSLFPFGRWHTEKGGTLGLDSQCGDVMNHNPTKHNAQKSLILPIDANQWHEQHLHHGRPCDAL